MKALIRILPVSVLVIASLAPRGNVPAQPREVEPVPGASFYEVQWLKERVSGEGGFQGPTMRFTRGFPDQPPGGFGYYRVRSVGSDGLAGPWSQVYAVRGEIKKEEDFQLPPSHYVIGRTEYYSLRTAERLRIRIQTKDSSSGFRNLWVKINERSYRRNENGVIELSEDGRYSIYWYAVDNVGHRSATEARFVLLDSSGPTLTTRILESGVTEQGEVTATAKLAILARDEGVGLAGLRWRSTVKEEWQKYTGPIPLNQHTSGQHGVIFIHAYDRLGNESPLKTFAFAIQQERPPDLPSSLVEKFSGTSVDEPVEVPPEGLEVDGLKEGESLTFEMENGDTIPVQNGDMVQFPAGKNRVTMTFTDQLGRKVTKVIEVVTDREPPETILKIQRKK